MVDLKSALGRDSLKFVQRLNASTHFQPNSTEELLEKVSEVGTFHRTMTMMEETIANVTEGDDITDHITNYMSLIDEFRAKILNGEDDDQVYKWTTKIGRLYDGGLFELIDKAKAACIREQALE
uniref:Uncharacterized protein n=1 Tax=Plectus sambesii TaxID=2011161 RepID=A0A914VCK3_9BILA